MKLVVIARHPSSALERGRTANHLHHGGLVWFENFYNFVRGLRPHSAIGTRQESLGRCGKIILITLSCITFNAAISVNTHISGLNMPSEQGNGFIEWNPELVDEDGGNELFALCVLFITLTGLSTGSRIGLRLFTKKGLDLSDYFIIISLAFNVTANALEIQMLGRGFGRHLQFLVVQDVLFIKERSQYLILLACIALWSVKVSASFFIITIIRDTHKIIKYTAYALIGVVTCTSLGQAIFWGLQAKPLRKLWTPNIPGTIQSPEVLVRSIIVFTAINSVTDLFYALAPIYFFGKLQLDLKKKITLIALTGSGLIVFATSIVRVAFDGDFFDPDFTWALHRVYLCTVIERNVAQIVADLPATFAMIRSLRKKSLTLLSRTQRTENKYYGYGSKDRGSQPTSKSIKGSFHDATNDHNSDEYPLRDWSPPNPQQGIQMQTRIDVSSHPAEANSKAGVDKNLVHPWSKLTSES